MYQLNHPTTSGTFTASSSTPSYVPSIHRYNNKSQRCDDSTSSKQVFGMVKTEEDGQFPFLSNLSQLSKPRLFPHASVLSWPSSPPLSTHNHATCSSCPHELEAHFVDVEYGTLNKRTSANPFPHPSMQRTPLKGHGPGRVDLNSIEYIPQTWGSHEHLDSNRYLGGYYGKLTPNAYLPGSGFISPFEDLCHAADCSHTYESRYPSNHIGSAQENGFEYRQQQFYFPGDHQSHPSRSHKRYSSNDYGRLVLSTSRIQGFATKILDLCCNQNGCRCLQAELATGDEETIEVIYNGVKPYFAVLMSDQFGNYLCQKLLETCNDTQRTELVKIIAPTIVIVSINKHGTRTVQKLLDHLALPEQIELVREALRPDVVSLTKDFNGNHVIKKCLSKLGANENQFIYDAIARSCMEVATHKYGCCVLQRCIDYANEQQSEQLYKELIKNTIPLSQDQFGNYVLQYILDKPDTNLTPIIRQFQHHIVQLSKAKISSNVIEKCVRMANATDRDFLIVEMTRPGAMAEMIDNTFANYVVQTALDYAEGERRTQLVKEIIPLLGSIKARSWCKRIMTKLGSGINNYPICDRYDLSRSSMAPRRYMDDGKR